MSDAGRCFCPKCKAPNTGPSCKCGVAYITAGEVAERRLRADPTHSNQKIAVEEGIDEATVRSKRSELIARSEIPDVEKTIGLDGKWRKSKQQKRHRTVRDTPDQRGRVLQANFTNINKPEFETFIAELPEGKTFEQGIADLVHEHVTDIPNLSKTKQDQFDTALRRHQRMLDDQFEQRVQSEIQKRLREMVYPRLEEKEKDAARIIKARKGIFTLDEYNAILRCLHPDMKPDNQQKAEAFQLWHESKIVLVSQKEDPKQYQKIPTIDELMRRNGRVN